MYDFKENKQYQSRKATKLLNVEIFNLGSLCLGIHRNGSENLCTKYTWM